MGRIEKGVCGLLLALGLFAFPATARASDGFLGGLEDLTGSREVQSQDYEQEYQESYDSSESLRSGGSDASEAIEIEEGQEIQAVVNAANTVTWGSTDRTLLTALRMFMGATSSSITPVTMFVLPAAGIVFFWWGLRKSKNMIMTAFRKGKASV